MAWVKITVPISKQEFLKYAGTFYENCIRVADAKNDDYAGDPGQCRDALANFRTAGKYGIAVRLSDKVMRLLNLLDPARKRKASVSLETVVDTCLDTANYAMLLALYYERGEAEVDDRQQALPCFDTDGSAAGLKN